MNRSMSRLIGVCAIALEGVLPGSALAQGAPSVMKLGTATINDSQHEWMKRFAALIDQSAGGRIKVEIYPTSQLGTNPRMIEGTQFGSIQGYVGPPESLAGLDTRFEILSAPGLFKDLAHANRTLQEPEFNAAFLALGSNRGLKGLGLFVSGPTVFVSRAPVRNLGDFEGKKIRVLASAMQTNQIRKLKASPIPMPLGETLPALQQGALDAVMSALPVLVSMRFYDAAKFMIDTEHSLFTAMTVINKTWFDNLSADLQKVVLDAGRRASIENYQWFADDLSRQREAWTKGGGQIVRFSDAEQAQLTKLMAPIGPDVTAQKADEKALFELLLRAAKRTE